MEITNPHLAARLARLDQEAAERRIRQAVATPTLIDHKAALLLGTALGRRPRTRYVAD